MGVGLLASIRRMNWQCGISYKDYRIMPIEPVSLL